MEMNQQNEGKIKNRMAEKRKLNEEENPEKKRTKPSIQRRPMPAELVNEMFACLPLEKGFNLLTKMPNFILARNIRKMLKSIKMAMKANKWNAADCGQKMIISEKGLKVKHSIQYGWNCVRTVLPLPKLIWNAKSIIAYFEVEIEKSHPQDYGIAVGFCTQQFPLEGWLLGCLENSIAIWRKGGMYIDGCSIEFSAAVEFECFYFGDVVGIGIVHSRENSPLKCFATCNGKLLGMVKLPVKFANLQMFPAVTLFKGISIRTNFGQNEWRFNPRQLCQ